MKRPQGPEVYDGVRARKRRKPGLVRIPLEQIGFNPMHGDGAGMSSRLLHDVAWSCLEKTTRLQHYQHVDIVEIPPDALELVRSANRVRCNRDGLMPRFSEAIQYVCVSKTHFVHAHKLAKDGDRFLNNGDRLIQWKDADTEGLAILEQGPVCAIYESSLFHDSPALHALRMQKKYANIWPQRGMQASASSLEDDDVTIASVSGVQ